MPDRRVVSVSGGSGAVVVFAGITDTFDRTVASGWGTGDSGQIWTTDTPSAVDGDRGWVESSAFLRNGTLSGDWPNELTVECELGAAGTPDSLDLIEVDFGASVPLGQPTLVWEFERGQAIRLSTFTPFAQSTGTAAFVPTTPHNLRMKVEGSTGYARIWAVGSAEPSTWILTIAVNSAIEGALDTIALGVDSGAGNPTRAYFNDLVAGGIPVLIYGR